MAQIVKIDCDELRGTILNNGFTLSGLSQNLGFGHSFLSNVLAKGSIPVHAYKLLVSELDLDYEKYIVKEHKQEETKPEENRNDDMSELITTINRLGNIQMQNMEYLKKIYDLLKEEKTQ